MSPLCTNRAEGFGPHSALHSSLPTSCFLDVVVGPLPTWIFLLTSPVLYFVLHRPLLSPSSTSSKSALDARRSRRRLARCLSVAYYVLLVALVAMISLEIARLMVAKLGVGLLPFTYVGILLALANRLWWRVRIARVANILYWLALAVVTAVKTATKHKEEGNAMAKIKGSGVDGKYPMSDQLLDNAVMVGVEVVLALLEVPARGLDWY